jgi:hypothetical protein
MNKSQHQHKLSPSLEDLLRFALSLNPSEILLGSSQAVMGNLGAKHVFLTLALNISNIMLGAGVQAE